MFYVEGALGWTQDSLDRLFISACLGQSQCAQVKAGGHRRNGVKEVPAVPVGPITWPRKQLLIEAYGIQQMGDGIVAF